MAQCLFAPHKHQPQPNLVLCPAALGVSISHIQSCRNFERVWPSIHCFQWGALGLGRRPVARECSRGKPEMCQVAFTNGPNNLPGTKAYLQLPYGIQSAPRYTWRFTFPSTRRRTPERYPDMSPKFLGFYDRRGHAPQKTEAKAKGAGVYIYT
jgi:hypothetical protein